MKECICIYIRTGKRKNERMRITRVQGSLSRDGYGV